MNENRQLYFYIVDKEKIFPDITPKLTILTK